MQHWLLQWIASLLQRMLTTVLHRALLWIRRRFDQPVPYWYLPIASAAGLVALFFALQSQTSTVNEAFVRTISSSQEPTPQIHKGLEAFLLSDLPPNLPKQLEALPPHRDLQDQLTKLRQEIERLMTNQLSTPDANAQSLPHPRLEPLLGKWPEHDIITDSDPDTFLFFPTPIIRWPSKPAALTPDSIDSALAQDRTLAHDIRTCRTAAPYLAQLCQTKVLDPNLPAVHELPLQTSPVQTFIITSQGIMRIRDCVESNQRDYYMKQFKPTLFFPSRPYFWPAFDKRPSSDHQGQSLGSLFHITRPYVDLGGNGPIVSLCTSLRPSARPLIPTSDAPVLCLDLGISTAGPPFASASIYRLGGRAEPADCNVSMKPLGCDPNNVSKDLWYSLDQAIKEMETESQPQLSDIRGMFHVLSHSVSKSQVAFSVPLGPPPGIAKDREVRFLVGDLNLVGRRRYQNLLTSGLAVCLLMLLSSVWLVVSYPNRRLRQQMASLDGALKAVETMVSGLPLGYCRLNGKDGFVDLNGTFATILGFHTIIDAKKVLDLWTFWGLLADEASRVEYERIQRARRKGEPTGPYFVRLSRLGSERKETVAVRVHGAAVPSPAGSEEDFPQTFAILEPQDPEATKQDDMMP